MATPNGALTTRKTNLPAISDQEIEQLETLREAASLAFSSANETDSIAASLKLAKNVAELRVVFDDPKLEAIIKALQDTPLGFRTDRDPSVKNYKTNQYNTPYEYRVVKEAVIEALLRGLQLVGNQFNIISGRFYCTKEGFQALIKRLPYVTNFKVNTGIPRGNVIPCVAEWQQNGNPTILETEISVKATDSSTGDQLVGKATRKLLARCYQQMTGNLMPDGDAEPTSFIAGKTSEAVQVSVIESKPLTNEQLEQIFAAVERVLTDVGSAAFMLDVPACYGVKELPDVPAEKFTEIMAALANTTSRERWNNGRKSKDNSVLLSEDEIKGLEYTTSNQTTISGGSKDNAANLESQII